MLCAVRVWKSVRHRNDNDRAGCLDGGRPEDHDAYQVQEPGRKLSRNQMLQAAGFRVRLGTTERQPTPRTWTNV
jgi:hypothetical protein